MHGGHSQRGPHAAAWKTGKHSTLLRDLGLSQRYEALRSNPELGELRHEIAVADLVVERTLAAALGPDSSPETRKELLDALEQRRKLVDSLHKNSAASVPVERVMAFVHAVTNVVLEVVPDVRLKTLFLERLRLLMGRRPDAPTVN